MMGRVASILMLCLLSGLAHAQDRASPHVHIMATDSILPDKLSSLQSWGADSGLEVTYQYVDGEPSEADDWRNADLVVFDTPLRGTPPSMLDPFIASLDQAGIAWINPTARRGMQPASGLSSENAQRLTAYYAAGGAENLQRFVLYASSWIVGADTSDIPAPEPLPETGFYHPDAPRIFTSYADYAAWGADRWPSDAPRFALVTSSSVVSDLQTAPLDALVAEAERQGVEPILFWFDRNSEAGMAGPLAEAEIDLIANSSHLQDSEARKDDLETLDVPGVILMQDRSQTPDQWRAADQGVGAGYAAVLMSTPEGWGMGDAIVISAVEDGAMVPIPEQVSLFVRKVESAARLRRAAPDERRLALFFWNTPSGERNVSASNLNVPVSVERITAALHEAGYDVEPRTEDQLITDFQAMMGGYYHPERLEALLAEGLAQSFPVARYQAWLDTLPDRVSARVTERWGAPEDHWAVHEVDGEQAFIIPAQSDGKLLMLPQPPRADAIGESYHDTLVPPGHLYLAAYLMVRERFETDTIIHLGTHGTQEWTPGKDRGLWAYDYPHLAVGDAVVIYPYIQDNVAEAIQAIRRGRATTISHQTPAFAPSGFYDELRDIHALIHEIEQLEDGPVRDDTLRRLAEASIAADISTDLGWSPEETLARPGDFLEPLHDHLHALAATAVPLGLHTFGEPAEPEHRVLTVMQQLGTPYYDLLPGDSEEFFAEDYDQIQSSEPYAFLQRFLLEDEPVDTIDNPELRALIEQAIANERHLAEDGEMEALLHALDGGFTPGGPGGDPVRNPRSSSGRNLYAFEPDKVPTRSAYEAGGRAFEQLLESHAQAHDGAVPNKLAFSIFSSDTIRTLGVTEAQIMHAIGVRPVWGRGDRIVDLEIISTEELDHPRVDVVLQLTSVYRDQFDGLMRLMAEAMDEISRMDEPGNGLFTGRARVRQSLLDRGVSAEEAERLSGLRLFSSAPGDYGTGVPDAALDSTNWDDDQVIADTFLQSQSYAFGADVWGEPVAAQGLLESQLEGVDAAVLSRSSNLHGILSTDHPFEHLGGLSATVRSITGDSPALYITDLRNTEPRTVGADQFLSTELRARYLNPQWIEAMQAEGYAGTVNMLRVTNNMFGWQVVDPSMVRDDQWQDWHETYVEDKHELGLNEWFAEHNPTAQAQIIERMAEAIRKGYWDANDETRQQLADRWTELTEELGADRGADLTAEFLQLQATGFGLDSGTPVADASAAQSPADVAQTANTETVTGQVMQAVESAVYERQNLPRQFGLGVLFAFFLLGAAQRVRRPRLHASS